MMPQHPNDPPGYIPEPQDAEAIRYGRLLSKLDPHLRSIVYALINRLADDAIRRPRREIKAP